MTPEHADLVLAERRGPVLVLTFNRPDKRNAWTDDPARTGTSRC